MAGHSLDDMRYSARDHRSSQLCLSKQHQPSEKYIFFYIITRVRIYYAVSGYFKTDKTFPKKKNNQNRFETGRV